MPAYPLPVDLPPPDPIAQAQGERLTASLRDEIVARGPMPFARFMDRALYTPGLGYYSAGSRKFGAAGDFVTAPEISSLFSQCLARYCVQALEALREGDILEFGAGSGVMAADLLESMEEMGCLPEQYLILELSGELRARQQQTLSMKIPHLTHRVSWLNRLPEPGFRGVILANEVIDAMPVHRFLITEEGPQEFYVIWQDDRFAWHLGPLSEERLARHLATLESKLTDRLPIDYASELNLMLGPWLASIAERLAAGVVLLIDYGFPRREYYHPQRARGTLMCHYRHRVHPDPLILVGLQDITAHVDFTAVAEAGEAAGLEVVGYTTQAHFLLGSGLDTRVTALMERLTPRAVIEFSTQVKKLTLPSEMGELFKAIALARNLPIELCGFTAHDLRHRL